MVETLDATASILWLVLIRARACLRNIILFSYLTTAGVERNVVGVADHLYTQAEDQDDSDPRIMMPRDAGESPRSGDADAMRENPLWFSVSLESSIGE